jgi:peptidyl-tRNA hydrolase, PTH2 family
MAVRPTTQVIVIRRDLKMRRGKEIAQGSHASMAFLTRRLNTVVRHPDETLCSLALTVAETTWLYSSFSKVTCWTDSEMELLRLDKAARDAGLQSHLVTDSGLTEFHGEPTITALAIGPDFADLIDPITGHLELY